MVRKISNLSNINIVNMLFLCAETRKAWEKEMPVPATMPEQIKTLRRRKNAYL